MANNWQQEELLLALHLYCRTQFGKLHRHNPDIIQLATALNRTPSAVALKLVNFASLDTSIHQKGMSNTSSEDRELWNAFMENSTEIAERAESLYELRVQNSELETPHISEIKIPYGPTETLREVKARRVQSFFRKAVLTSYNNRCAISGLAIPELLVASHIIPWAENENRRADPTNGIALSALYDKAFDRHLISFDQDFKLVLSERLKKETEDEMVKDYFWRFDGKLLEMLNRFLPDGSAMALHRKSIAFRC